MCKRNDFLKIREINEDAFKGNETSPITFKVSERLHRTTIFIAEHDGKPVGYVYGMRSQVVPEEGWIRQVAVIKDYQRKGIARELQKRCIDAFRKMDGVKYIELSVKPENTPAINLYKSLGFNFSKTEPGHETIEIYGKIAIKDYYGHGEHRFIMQKEL